VLENSLKRRHSVAATQQIAAWLKKLGMSEYAERFVENKIDISVLPDLTEQHLKDLGIALGDRLKILRDPRSRPRFCCRNGILGAHGDWAS
jgi:hypothetical protein